MTRTGEHRQQQIQHILGHLQLRGLDDARERAW
jgi:hypothetical protein